MQQRWTHFDHIFLKQGLGLDNEDDAVYDGHAKQVHVTPCKV